MIVRRWWALACWAPLPSSELFGAPLSGCEVPRLSAGCELRISKIAIQLSIVCYSKSLNMQQVVVLTEKVTNGKYSVRK